MKAPDELEVLSNSATVSSTTSDPVGRQQHRHRDHHGQRLGRPVDRQEGLGRPVAAGTNFSYTLDGSNGGPSGAHNVKVVDTLPAGVTFVSASGGATWSCAYSIITNKVTCDLTGTLASGASAATITVDGRSAPNEPGGPVQLGHSVLRRRRPGGRQQHRHRDHHGQRLGRPRRSSRRTRPTPWRPARTSSHTPRRLQTAGPRAPTTSRSWTPCRPASRSSRPRAGPPGPAPTASSPTRSPAT